MIDQIVQGWNAFAAAAVVMFPQWRLMLEFLIFVNLFLKWAHERANVLRLEELVEQNAAGRAELLRLIAKGDLTVEEDADLSDVSLNNRCTG